MAISNIVKYESSFDYELLHPVNGTGLKIWFTGKKLSDYITLQKSDFRNARRIVNLMDKADLIAGYARAYDKLLVAEGYGVEQVAKQRVSHSARKCLHQFKLLTTDVLALAIN